MKNLYIFFCLLAVMLCICGCGGKGKSFSYSEASSDTNSIMAADKGIFSEKSSITGSDTVAKSETASKGVHVSVLGFVANPGVYIMKSGSRVYEAVNAAGGVIDGADINGVDLVNIIKEGSRIYVPGNLPEDAGMAGALGIASGKKMVNINLASVTDFCALPGIGESKASLIVSYRDKNGPFASVEDIMKVSGIKGGTFEKIKDYITVY